MDHSTFAGFQANIGSSCSTQFIIFFWPSPRVHIVKKDGTSHALNMCISDKLLRPSKMKYDTAIPQLSHHAANCSITQQTGAPVHAGADCSIITLPRAIKARVWPAQQACCIKRSASEVRSALVHSPHTSKKFQWGVRQTL